MSKLVRELAKSHLDAERRSRFEKQQKVMAEEKRQKALTGLVDFVPRINPRFVPPVHLAAVAELFERAERGPIRAVVSAPPRHGKTELLLTAVAWRCLRHPELTNCYATYNLPFALSKSRVARDYALAAGVQLREDAASLTEWRTHHGGGLLATSVGGVLTGHGVNMLLIDDPHKDRAHAESAVDRAFIHEWFRGTAMTRVEPGGSVIVFHTRWREDDLIGELLRDEENEWENVWLPAISDAGEPLWPERWTVEALTKRRSEVGEYDWASQYQGRPQPKSGQLFGDVTFYDELPKDGYRIGIGVDMAYSTKKKADWSVAVVCYRRGDIVYVADVIRMQELQPKFHARLKAESDNRYKGARWRMYVSSTEKGLTDMAQADGLPLVGVLATQDKYVRALPAAAAWNAGKLRVPRDAPWLEEFLRELQAFDKGRYDDQVDALAAAFDCLDTPSQKTPDVRVHQPDTAGLYVDD